MFDAKVWLLQLQISECFQCKQPWSLTVWDTIESRLAEMGLCTFVVKTKQNKTKIK